MTDPGAVPPGVLLVSEGPLAHAIRDLARQRLGARAEPLAALSLPQGPADTRRLALSEALVRADRGGGVLVLADQAGEAAANLAQSLLIQGRTLALVPALTPAMAIEAAIALAEVPGPALAALAQRVVDAGRRGIFALFG